MSPDEAARGELHLSHSRDRERDGDVDLLLTALGDADAQDPPAGTGRRRRLGRRGGGGRARWGRPRPFVDIAERAKQTIGLLDVDLAVRQELQDLLALIAGHLTASVRVIERGRGVVDAELATRKTLEHRAHLFT